MTKGRRSGRPPHDGLLTPSEWRVVEGVRHGLTNRQIAVRRMTSLDAVKFHVSNILGKLGFISRAQLMLWDGIEEGTAMESENSISSQAAGNIVQVARTVSDLAYAKAWYQEALGLHHLFSAGGMAFFGCGGLRLMLSEGDPAPESILYFSTDNIRARFAELQKQGSKVLSAPHRVHTHEDGTEEWMCFFEDPDGRPLALTSVVSNP